jgi:hypothetical protein
MENVYLFCNHLVYITTIWYSLWPFGILGVIWYISTPFWYTVSRKIWQPWFQLQIFTKHDFRFAPRHSTPCDTVRIDSNFGWMVSYDTTWHKDPDSCKYYIRMYVCTCSE